MKHGHSMQCFQTLISTAAVCFVVQRENNRFSLWIKPFIATMKESGCVRIRVVFVRSDIFLQSYCSVVSCSAVYAVIQYGSNFFSLWLKTCNVVVL